MFVKPGKTRSAETEAMQNSLLTKEEWRHWAVHCIWDDIPPRNQDQFKGKNYIRSYGPFP